MTERLADIGAHIHAVRQVGAVVNAMRGLAGVRAQRGRALLPAIRAYADVSARAIGQALALALQGEEPGRAPAPAGARPALIVFGAQQGFAGAFADKVLDVAEPWMARAHVMMAGARSVVIARERRLDVGWSIDMPDRTASIAAMATELSDALYDHVTTSGVAAAAMIVPVWNPGLGIAVEHRQILPLDPAQLPGRPHGEVPLTSLPPRVLLERLAEEYVFAQVCAAAMEAYAAENQARVQAMAAAKTHIDEQLQALRQREHQVRQDEITAEVIELATAAKRSR